MALRKPKNKKYPKKPKKNASIEVKQNYLSKVKAIDSQNAEALREYTAKKSINEKLDKQIASVGTATPFRASTGTKRRKSTGSKTTKRKGARKTKMKVVYRRRRAA